MRQGNSFPHVFLFRYLTQGINGFPGFDSFLWQKIEQKQNGFSVIENNPFSHRLIEDADPFLASAALMKAIATGDDRILRRETLKQELSVLQLEKDGWYSTTCEQQLRLQQRIKRKEGYADRLQQIEDDLEILESFSKEMPLHCIDDNPSLTKKEEIKKFLAEKEVEFEKSYTTRFDMAYIGHFTLLFMKSGGSNHIALYLEGEGLYRVNRQDVYQQSRDHYISILETQKTDLEKMLDEEIKAIALISDIEKTFSKQDILDSLKVDIKTLELELGMAQEVDENGVPIDAPPPKYDHPLEIIDRYDLKVGKVLDHEITSDLIEDLKDQLATEKPEWQDKMDTSIMVVQEKLEQLEDHRPQLVIAGEGFSPSPDYANQTPSEDDWSFLDSFANYSEDDDEDIEESNNESFEDENCDQDDDWSFLDSFANYSEDDDDEEIEEYLSQFPSL